MTIIVAVKSIKGAAIAANAGSLLGDMAINGINKIRVLDDHVVTAAAGSVVSGQAAQELVLNDKMAREIAAIRKKTCKLPISEFPRALTTYFVTTVYERLLDLSKARGYYREPEGDSAPTLMWNDFLILTYGEIVWIDHNGCVAFPESYIAIGSAREQATIALRLLCAKWTVQPTLESAESLALQTIRAVQRTTIRCGFTGDPPETARSLIFSRNNVGENKGTRQTGKEAAK